MTNKLDEIKARRDATTKGPWRLVRPDSENPVIFSVTDKPETNTDPDTLADCYNYSDGQDEKNATFIAHAPADIDWLIAELEKAREDKSVLLKTFGWQPMCDAPRDGTTIIGLYEGEPEGVLINWAESRRCMLAGVGGGNGYFGPGWEDDLNSLIMDDPIAWKPEQAMQKEAK